MNPWLDNLIKEARAGNDLAGRTLVALVVEYLEKGEIPPPALNEYFCKAGRKIARGSSADKELNTARKSIREKFERDCGIARKVWHLSHRAVNRLPLTLDGAYGAVASEYCINPETVKTVYRKMRWLVDAEAFMLAVEHEAPDVPEDHLEEWLEARRHIQAEMHEVFARLFNALKK